MPEVQNIGAVDYAQYQPQPQAEYDNYADYNTQPEVYDENYAQMQEASKSRLGATILTSLIIGGGALIGGYFWGGKGKKAAEIAKKSAEEAQQAAEQALETLKNSEAVRNYDKLKETAQTAMADAEKLADEKAGKLFDSERCGKGFQKKLDEFFKPVKDNIAKAEEEAKVAKEKAEAEAKAAAEKAGEETAEAGEKAANEAAE